MRRRGDLNVFIAAKFGGGGGFSIFCAHQGTMYK